jgi:hypothetical protein
VSQPLSNFNVNLAVAVYTVDGPGAVTAPLRYRAVAMAGWALPNTDFNEQTRMTCGTIDGSVELVALYDANGNPRQDFLTLPWQGGVNEGFAAFRILRPYMPGGNYTDAFLRATDLRNIVTGSGQWTHVLIGSTPPAEHIYETKNNGVTVGVVHVPEPEHVTIFRDGALIYQSG